MRPARRPLRRPLLALTGGALLAALPACSSAPKDEPADGPTAREAAVLEEVREAERQRLARAAERDAQAEAGGQAVADGDGKGAKKKRDLPAEIESKRRKLYTSELELAIAEKKAEANLADKQNAVAAARRKAVAAGAELSRYQTHESKVLGAKATLRVDRNAFRLEELEQELAQMQAEYGKYQKDSPARLTGDIVIGRVEKQIEFAKRELQLSNADQKQLSDHTIPRKLADLEGAAEVADAGLAQATAALDRANFENKLSVTKARNAMLEAKDALAKLEKEAAEAAKQPVDGGGDA